MATARENSYLRRLPPEAYRGSAVVHWIYTVDGRETGWLDEMFHCRFREILLHAASKCGFLCPAYCLMPDHMHLVWMGLEVTADLRLASRSVRRELNGILLETGHKLQKQGYDRVLRDRERKRFAFEQMVGYVLANPDRAGLPEGLAISGMLVPGYPRMRRSLLDYPEDWEPFWKIFEQLKEPSSGRWKSSGTTHG